MRKSDPKLLDPKCPVCGKHILPAAGGCWICPVCDWQDELSARIHPDEIIVCNEMSLNTARERYKKTGSIYKD